MKSPEKSLPLGARIMFNFAMSIGVILTALALLDVMLKMDIGFRYQDVVYGLVFIAGGFALRRVSEMMLRWMGLT